MKSSWPGKFALGTASLFAAAGAQAAGEGKAAGDQLEEVIVSARFAAEQAQRTPLAISTVTAEMMETRGVTDLADIAAFVPNVTLVQSGQQYGRSVTAFVRGIGQADSSIAFSPAVAVYLDDVYIGAMTGSDLDLVDIAGVDVLRGPQGTLFGANSESGALVIHTVKPKGDYSGYASIGYGSFQHIKSTAGFDMPLLENKLFLRASGVAEKQKGYQQVLDYPCLALKDKSLRAGNLPLVGTPAGGCKLGNFGGTDVAGGRLALRWLASENLEVNLAADLLNETGSPQANAAVAFNPTQLAVLNSKLLSAGLGVQLDNRFIPKSPFISYDSSYDVLGNHFAKPEEPLMNFGYSASVNWAPSENLNVKWVSAYRRAYGSQYTSNSASPIATGLSNQYTDRNQVSQELSLSGRLFDNKLDWAVGGFYYKANADYSGDIDLPGIVLPFPAILEFYPTEKAIDENKSVFAHAIYHVSDAFGVEVGIRHTSQDKMFSELQVAAPGKFGIPLPGDPVYQSATKTDPKISLQYQWSPDLMTYVTYATGFKGGGVNPYVVADPAEATPFGPESVKSYEFGVKSEWLDHHLRVNGAVFQMDYTDLQEQVNMDTAPLPIHINVGKARLKGLELEVQARFGGFSGNLAASYLDYKTVDCGVACVSAGRGGTIPLDGVAPLTPKHKLNAGLQYLFDIGAGGSITPRFDYTYQSKVYFDTSNLELASQDAYSVANARVMWADADNKWSASVAVTNLTDKTYFLNMYNIYNSGLGSLTGQPAHPREWFFQIKRKF